MRSRTKRVDPRFLLWVLVGLVCATVGSAVITLTMALAVSQLN